MASLYNGDVIPSLIERSPSPAQSKLERALTLQIEDGEVFILPRLLSIYWRYDSASSITSS
jgi:hypothetical protein